ncbi:MAG TPA: hypothetical protein VIC54_04945 [Terriglobales bacterium]
MRYVLIVLGLITTALAAVLALQGLWWAAIPAGFFGVGIPWVAWVSLRDEKRAQLGALGPEAKPAPEPPPQPSAAAPTPAVEPASPPPVPPPVYPRPAPRPAHAHSRTRRKKHR